MDPADRFENAAEAHINNQGAADYHGQLLLDNSSENVEYEHEIGLWLEETMLGDEPAVKWRALVCFDTDHFRNRQALSGISNRALY